MFFFLLDFFEPSQKAAEQNLSLQIDSKKLLEDYLSKSSPKDEWWGYMDDENDRWLLQQCKRIAKELKVNPNIISEAYYSSRFDARTVGMTHIENGKCLIRVKYNQGRGNSMCEEREIIVHEVCHAIAYAQGFSGHTPLWAGYMRQYAKLHPELAFAIEQDVRRYEAGLFGGIE